MGNTSKRSKASSSDACGSSHDIADHENPLLASGVEDGTAGSPASFTVVDDPVLKAVFARIRRDLSFIAQHHPHLKMSSEELSVWAKAIARQLTAEALTEDHENEVIH